MPTDQIIQLLTLIFTTVIGVVGFAATIVQIAKSNKVKKAEFVENLLNDLRTNELLVEGNYIIEYKDNWFNSEFRKSQAEKCIDALLAKYDYICYLLNRKLIKIGDLSFFEYKMQRLSENDDLKQYLEMINSIPNADKCQFEYLHLLNYLQDNYWGKIITSK